MRLPLFFLSKFKEESIMLEGYSLNVVAAANTAFPFNNVTIQKGCTAVFNTVNTIQLNKCGVYMVACNGSAAAASTIQLAKDGVLQPQAQSTGTSPAFVTLVQVPHNNSNCCCASPTRIQIVNPTVAAETLTSINIVVTKIC